MLSAYAMLQSLFRVRGHALSALGLDRDTVVVDAGAHRGEFSRALADRFGCRCYLIEANSQLADALTRQNEFPGVLSAALGAEDGHASFYVRENLEASSMFDRGAVPLAATDIEVVSLPTMMRRHGITRIDVLKLDIEGAEFDLLTHCPDDIITAIGQITVEFHDFQRAFQGRGLYQGVRRRLRSLGFACCSTAIRTHGDVLFLNRRQFPMSAAAQRTTEALAKWRLRWAS